MVSAALLDVSSIANENPVLVPVENLCVGAIEQGQSIDVETSDCYLAGGAGVASLKEPFSSALAICRWNVNCAAVVAARGLVNPCCG